VAKSINQSISQVKQSIKTSHFQVYTELSRPGKTKLNKTKWLSHEKPELKQRLQCVKVGF